MMMMMRVVSSSLVVALIACTTNDVSAAYQQQPLAASSSSRRAFFEKAAAGVGVGVVVSTTTAAPPSAQALEACPAKTSNCIRTTWTPPENTTPGDIAATVLDVLNAYPQDGQADADKGGYTIVSEDLAVSGTAAIEYRSGIGNFAKFLNGGKPFVDDLKLEVKDGVVLVRSASRVGDSDFKVNQKRLTYLAQSLREKGWQVPEPTY